MDCLSLECLRTAGEVAAVAVHEDGDAAVRVQLDEPRLFLRSFPNIYGMYTI